MNFLRRLALQEKTTWWQLAFRCCWNRARPWHASELVSFLVLLRTYHHPGNILSRSALISHHTAIIPLSERVKIPAYALRIPACQPHAAGPLHYHHNSQPATLWFVSFLRFVKGIWALLWCYEALIGYLPTFGTNIPITAEEWKTNLSLAILFYFLCVQHVSDINISIIRSLRLCWWITTSVALFSVRCVLEIWCGDCLRAGRSGIESRWGRDFPPVQTSPGAHPAFCTMGTGSFPGVKCGRGVLLTTHLLLVPRSWKSRAIPLPTLWAT